MKARLAHILSRLSIVSVVAVSAVGVTACSNAKTTDTQAAAQPVQAAPAAHRGPGTFAFREIEALDLSDAQRETLADVEQNLAADLAPHRETMRQVAETLASSIEAGRVDPEEIAAQKAALVAAAADARASFASAMNQVHDALDQSQRADLVARLRARHDHHGPQDEAHHQQAMAKLVTELSLTEDQKQAIHEAVRGGLEKVFPDRKVRREAWEAKSKALADAFVRDDFNAEDFDMAEGAEEAIASFSQVVEHAVDVSGKVLGPSQRVALAALIRERANSTEHGAEH
jgi:Spy/CpxP family protein refolding chaperone